MDRVLSLPSGLRGRAVLLGIAAVTLLAGAVKWRLSQHVNGSPQPVHFAPASAMALPAMHPPPASRGLDAARIPLLAPRWRYQFGKHPKEHPPLLIALDDALILRDGDVMKRVRLTDGAVTARQNLPCASDEDETTVAAAGNLVAAGAAAVRARDGQTLAPRWRRDLNEGVGGTVVAVGTDRVLAIRESKKHEGPYILHLLDAATGRLLWRRDFAGDAWICTFKADAQRIYADCYSRGLIGTRYLLTALAADSGRELWQKPLNGVTRDLVSSGVWVAWADVDPQIVVADAASGETLRRVERKQTYEQQQQFTLDGGDLIFLDDQQRVTALEVASGLVRWQKKIDIDSFLTQAVAGAVYVFGRRGELQVRDRAHGELLWSWSSGMDASALSLPDATGQRPLLVHSGDRLLAFAPGAQPIPIEHAVVAGHVYNLTPSFGYANLDLSIGQVKASIDARGNYRVVLSDRGTPGLRAEVGAGFVRKHGEDDATCLESGDCAVLVPLIGRGHYHVDLDVKVEPEDCN